MHSDTLEKQAGRNENELQTDFTIRPFREEDRAAIVEINNRDMPPHRHWSVEEWIRGDERMTGKEVYIRLVVGDPAIAFLEVFDWGTTAWVMEDVCGFELTVAHEYRRRGIGSMLYEKAVEFAQERNAKRLVTYFHEHSPQEPAIAFLRERGFSEQEREKPSYLDMAKFDPAPFAAALDKAEAAGVRIFAWSEIEDDEVNRRRFFEMWGQLIYDIPRRDNQQFKLPLFEQWVKDIFDRPEFAAEATMLAEVDGELAGVSQLMFKVGKPVGMTWLTGVLSKYRGRSIATALKVRAIEAARARGCQVITTENHDDNAPMLAINRKFGFTPEAPLVSYNKVLREESKEE